MATWQYIWVLLRSYIRVSWLSGKILLPNLEDERVQHGLTDYDVQHVGPRDLVTAARAPWTLTALTAGTMW